MSDNNEKEKENEKENVVLEGEVEISIHNPVESVRITSKLGVAYYVSTSTNSQSEDGTSYYAIISLSDLRNKTNSNIVEFKAEALPKDNTLGNETDWEVIQGEDVISLQDNDGTVAVNNYGYAILASEITKSILLNGLDPYCGLLHYDMDMRTSLTFDLIEPFRQQIVDKTVISLINRKQVKTEDIDNRNNLIKLNARKVIVSKILNKMYSTITYNGQEMSYADIIESQSKNLVNTIINGDEFKAFYLTW